ncbi:MAG: CrcB family protein, partial [Herbiconiux sp.]|nr:CrcB family protein [Herbiconiux sp.]
EHGAIRAPGRYGGAVTSAPPPPSIARERPLHLRGRWIALVAAGGVFGTALREAVALLVQPIGSFPVAIFGINVVGAFVLGVLLQVLALRGPDTGWRRRVRLFAGTGILGGFTTYSALSTDSAAMLTDGGFTLAIVYGGATVLVGALASGAGILLGGRLGARPRGPAPLTDLPDDPRTFPHQPLIDPDAGDDR